MMNEQIQELQAEQEPVAEVVLRNQTVGFGRTEERKDVMFLADVDVGTKLYAAAQPVNEVELTDGEIWGALHAKGLMEGIRAVIAAHKEKNR